VTTDHAWIRSLSAAWPLALVCVAVLALALELLHVARPHHRGSTGQGTAEAMPFAISGDVHGLAPGVTRTIVLTLENPNAKPINVTSVVVDVTEGSGRPGCAEGPNLRVEQATAITQADPVVVPPRGSVQLRSAPLAPRITLRDRSRRQDGCKRTSFSLAYSGSAHS
jgi:hypothetical protein